MKTHRTPLSFKDVAKDAWPIFLSGIQNIVCLGALFWVLDVRFTTVSTAAATAALLIWFKTIK